MRFRPKARKLPLEIRFGLCVLATFLVLYFGNNMFMFGSLVPRSHVDHLNNATNVIRWDEDGLVLTGGRRVIPQGMTKLPKDSATLAIATKEGVEVTPDGRVFGLVKLWHWCGNDAVRYDLSKIDLAQLLAYHHEGQSTLKPYEYSKHSFVETGGGSDHGWSISSFSRMKMMFSPKYADIFGPRNEK